MNIYFSDVFDVSEDIIDDYGAFNISVLTDLPLFIDPFLLFNSKKSEYVFLHENILEYLRFLKMKSTSGLINESLLKSWYYFGEVKQNWFGFCETGNQGRGLGEKFAKALNSNLHDIFPEFGEEKLTEGTHLEKLCLIEDGVGRDMISDFTTNLIKYYLLNYTEKFTQKHINPKYINKFVIEKVRFNYDTETWCSESFDLPTYEDDFVILTPRDILTRDDNWINKTDFIKEFRDIPLAIENDALRAQVENYFKRQLPKKPRKKDYDRAAAATIRKFPKLVDYFIKYKEERGDRAKKISTDKVKDSKKLYVKQFRRIPELLYQETDFYSIIGNTSSEALARINYLKDVIENKGGHHIFYVKGEPLRVEKDLHILYRLTWYATPSDVSREVDDGRGPADFKISRGSTDKTIVEFKLARNTQLKRNLANQAEIYQKASDAETAYKVIIFFNQSEYNSVIKILTELGIEDSPYIILIDADNSTKPSASKA